MLKQIPLIYEVHSGLLARLNQLDKKKCIIINNNRNTR